MSVLLRAISALFSRLRLDREIEENRGDLAAAPGTTTTKTSSHVHRGATLEYPLSCFSFSSRREGICSCKIHTHKCVAVFFAKKASFPFRGERDCGETYVHSCLFFPLRSLQRRKRGRKMSFSPQIIRHCQVSVAFSRPQRAQRTANVCAFLR